MGRRNHPKTRRLVDYVGDAMEETDQQLETIICDLGTPYTSHQNNSSCMKKLVHERTKYWKIWQRMVVFIRFFQESSL